MPINTGDAVMTFLADATQLDLAFDQIAGNADKKLGPAAEAANKVGTALDDAGKKGQAAGTQINEAWLKVARATQENRDAQERLREAMDGLKKSGSDNSVAMATLAAAQERAAATAIELTEATKAATEAGVREASGLRERRESMAAIGELSGVTIPRGLRTWIAEMPLLGAAMEAAFSVLAPLLLISTLSEGITKLVEWHEAAEKLAESWESDNTTFRKTSTEIKQQIDDQKQKFIELTQGPIAAYEFALHHIKSTFDETVGKVAGELDKQGQGFEARGGWFKQMFFGNDEAGALKAGKDMLEFSKQLQQNMKTAQDAAKDNPFAGMDSGIARVQEKIGELDKDIKKEHDMIQGDDHSFALRGLDEASLQRYRTVLQMVGQLLQESRDLEKARRDADTKQINSDELAKKRSLEEAKVDVEKTFLLAGLAIRSEIDKVTFEHGKESLNQYLQQVKEAENERYGIEKAAMERRIAELGKDPARNAQELIKANGDLEVLEANHQLAMMKIDEDGYRQQANQTVKALEIIISKTKEGTQQRIDAENALLAFFKSTYGAQSDAYLQQQAKVESAVLAFNNLQKLLIKEEAHEQEHSMEQKVKSELAYYSFLKSTSQISAAELVGIQQEADEKLYQGKRNVLLAELALLGPQEVLARKKVNDALTLLDEEHENTRKLLFAQSAEVMNAYYTQLGIKSTQTIMRERDLAMESYKAIAKSGTASYGQILQAQIKVLQAQIELDAAEGKNVSKEVAALDKLTKAYNRLQFAMGHVAAQGKLSEAMFKTLGIDISMMGGVVQNVALGATAALGQMFQAWAQGGMTVEQACLQITKAILQSIAQYAFAQAVVEMAKGFAALAPTSPDFGHAGEHFTSAALWFAAGAATSLVGGVISNATSGASASTSAGSAAGSSVTGTASSPSAPNPVQKVNVQSFASGGLITGPTLAMMGDREGSDQRSAVEAAIPLDDPRALERVGRAIGEHSGGGGSGTVIHVHVKGLVSPDSLTKVVKQINRKVERGGGSLTASKSFKVTKR